MFVHPSCNSFASVEVVVRMMHRIEAAVCENSLLGCRTLMSLEHPISIILIYE